MNLSFGKAKPEPDYKLSPKGAALPTFLGRIIMLKGSANRLASDGKRYALKIQDKIKKKHVIETGKASFMKIKLVDKSIFTLSGSSKMNFQDFQYKSPKDRRGVFNLIRGRLRASIPVKTKKDALKIISGTASMGIRGTKVLVNNRLDKEGNRIIQMALLEGEVEIVNSKSKEKVGLLPGDHFILVENKGGLLEEDRILKLDEKVVVELKAVDEEEKKILPFLPFYYVKGKKSVKNKFFKGSGIKKTDKGPKPLLSLKEKLEIKKKNWKRVLKSLNKILDENRREESSN
jgi:hypothetical protein